MPLTNTYHMNCFRIFTPRYRHWDPLNRMTGCLVARVTCDLHAETQIVVAVLWVVQHNVSHVDVGERMITSKTGLIYVLAWATWAGRSVTTNDNSTNVDGDTTIHSYKNAISGISAPFYCNIVSSWMSKKQWSHIKSRDRLAEYVSVILRHLFFHRVYNSSFIREGTMHNP